jgi:hypothetical protein
MITNENIDLIVNIVTLIGVVFAVYLAVRKPQERSEITDAEMRKDIIALRVDLINLRDNHVHTLDTKLDVTNKAVQDLSLQLTRLNTIIEERIPKNK